MAFEVSSLNAGLKTYILQQDNPAYSAREEILNTETSEFTLIETRLN
jgi:hypothetical protein